MNNLVYKVSAGVHQQLKWYTCVLSCKIPKCVHLCVTTSCSFCSILLYVYKLMVIIHQLHIFISINYTYTTTQCSFVPFKACQGMPGSVLNTNGKEYL